MGMKKSITNGSPGIYMPGVDDQSVRPYTRVPETYPQHLPKFFIYAGQGPSVKDQYAEQLLVGNERLLMYGDDAFLERSKYFTHQVIHANGVNRYGNQAMYVRILGRNHGPKPTIRIWADILPTKVDLYERNPDNSIKLDAVGQLVVTGQADGHRIKYVVDHIATEANKNEFGTLDPREGDQVDAATGVKSTRYPIMEFRHSFYGEPGNMSGIRLWAQTSENTAWLPNSMINKERAFPYSFAVIRKQVKTGNAKLIKSIFQETSMTFVLKENVIDPSIDMRMHLTDRAVKEHENLTDLRYPQRFAEFNGLKVYQNNIDTIQGLLHAAEIPFLQMDSDFTADPSEKYMVNILTGVDLKNNPYHSLNFVDSADSVRFSQETNIYAQGGDDGQMTPKNFAEDVAEYMRRYADFDDELMDLAFHIESHFYDTGFPLSEKYDMLKFISERKDTFVVLCTFEFGERILTQAEEMSVARSLLNRLWMYPESTHFGTQVYRGMIQGCTGRIRNSLYDGHVSTSYEVAVKSAKYMGAGHGRFKGEYRFEGYPGHIVDDMYDLSITWVPDSIRVRNWDLGLNYVARFDRKQFYFPAFKTVYGEDTSVLTSYITACIFLRANKALAKCQRVFSGRSDLTMPEFSRAVNDWLSNELKDLFDDRVIIKPKAHFTSLDQALNYSWTVPLEIGAPGMKTVMTGYAVARRIEDMIAETNS